MGALAALESIALSGPAQLQGAVQPSSRDPQLQACAAAGAKSRAVVPLVNPFSGSISLMLGL